MRLALAVLTSRPTRRFMNGLPLSRCRPFGSRLPLGHTWDLISPAPYLTRNFSALASPRPGRACRCSGATDRIGIRIQPYLVVLVLLSRLGHRSQAG